MALRATRTCRNRSCGRVSSSRRALASARALATLAHTSWRTGGHGGGDARYVGRVRCQQEGLSLSTKHAARMHALLARLRTRRPTASLHRRVAWPMREAPRANALTHLPRPRSTASAGTSFQARTTLPAALHKSLESLGPAPTGRSPTFCSAHGTPAEASSTNTARDAADDAHAAHDAGQRQLLLDAAMTHVGALVRLACSRCRARVTSSAQGWTDDALRAAAHDLGLSVAAVGTPSPCWQARVRSRLTLSLPLHAGLLPRGPAELVEHFSAKCDVDLAFELKKRKEELAGACWEQVPTSARC